MTIDLDELERLAKAAAPGPWEQNEGCVHDALGDCVTLDTSSGAYIAAANPETVLALVQRVRELERVARGALELTDMEDTLQHEAIRNALGID